MWMRMKDTNAASSFTIRVLRNIERKHLWLLAAGLAYYFIMSLFPALILVAAVAAYLPIQEGLQVATTFLGYVLPPPAMSLFSQLLTSIRTHRAGLLSFGIIVLVWLSSKGIKGIIAGLDIVHEVRAPRRVWTNRALAFGLTFGVGVLLLLGVTLTLAGPLLKALLSRIVPPQSLLLQAWPYLQWIPAAFFIFTAIELLYVLAPNLPYRERVTVPGAVAVTVTLLALSTGLGFYFQQFGETKLIRFYEFLATPVAVMIWLYWSAFAILVGAEINVSLQFYKKSSAADPKEAAPPEKLDAA
jgi:membrane protein